MTTEHLNKGLTLQLGYAGLIPFLLMTLGVWFADASWLTDILNVQMAYGMVILSFLGGVHWGAALLGSTMPEVNIRKALAWGVTPSLIAWSAPLLGRFEWAMLIVGFIAALQVDKQMYPVYGMPEWMLVLRKKLTFVVVLSLVLTTVGAYLRG